MPRKREDAGQPPHRFLPGKPGSRREKLPRRRRRKRVGRGRGQRTEEEEGPRRLARSMAALPPQTGPRAPPLGPGASRRGERTDEPGNGRLRPPTTPRRDGRPLLRGGGRQGVRPPLCRLLRAWREIGPGAWRPGARPFRLAAAPVPGCRRDRAGRRWDPHLRAGRRPAPPLPAPQTARECRCEVGVHGPRLLGAKLLTVTVESIELLAQPVTSPSSPKFPNCTLNPCLLGSTVRV